MVERSLFLCATPDFALGTQCVSGPLADYVGEPVSSPSLHVHSHSAC